MTFMAYCMRADVWGTCALLACLGAGSLYQQPPLRKAAAVQKAEQAALLEKEKEDAPNVGMLKLAEEGVGSPESSLVIPSQKLSPPRNGHKESSA